MRVTKARDDVGEFEAVVSVFGNVDLHGDVVVKGAFTRSLAEWEASGDPIPVYWSHRMDDPHANIGSVISAAETAEGLHVRGRLDRGEPLADKCYALLKGRRVREFSFGFTVVGGRPGERDGKSIYELTDLDLHEVSIVPLGANPETRLVEVKAAGGGGSVRARLDRARAEIVAVKARMPG